MEGVRVRAPLLECVLRQRLVDFRPAVSRVLVATIAMQSQRPDSQRPEVNPFHGFRRFEPSRCLPAAQPVPTGHRLVRPSGASQFRSSVAHQGSRQLLKVRPRPG